MDLARKNFSTFVYGNGGGKIWKFILDKNRSFGFPVYKDLLLHGKSYVYDIFFIERYKGVKQRYEAVFFDFSFLFFFLYFMKIPKSSL